MGEGGRNTRKAAAPMPTMPAKSEVILCYCRFDVVVLGIRWIFV